MNCKAIILVLVLYFTGASNSLAQDAAPAELIPYFSAIIVEDIEVSRNWYTEILGFEIALESQIAEGFTLVNLKKGNAALELIQLPGALSPHEVVENYHSKTRIKGFFKAGFQVKNLDEWVDFFIDKNVQFNGHVVTDPVSNKRMVIILDPDGNRIQLFEQ